MAGTMIEVRLHIVFSTKHRVGDRSCPPRGVTSRH